MPLATAFMIRMSCFTVTFSVETHWKALSELYKTVKLGILHVFIKSYAIQKGG